MKTNSRQIIFEILKKVFKKNAFSNILLNEISKSDLNQKFKNLIFAVVHGTITNKILLEKVANKLIDSRKTNIDIQILLWMSIYQIRFLKTIPHYAIVNEAVILASKISQKLSGFVNATLKNIIRNETELFDFSYLSHEELICTINSFPKKLFDLIKNQFGIDIAIKVAQDSVNKPQISFRVNNLKISTKSFFEKYANELLLSKTNVEDCLITSLPIVKTAFYKEGLITIQDPMSIEVVNILKPKPNTRVLDMCSAPGGKLTHISMKMQNTGEIVACEISKNKIKLIEQNIDRLACENIKLNCIDATLIKDFKKFDSILLDAPCSGFGVLKRKPEIKIKNYESQKISEIVNVQKRLLENAYSNLKAGGELVYSTCTINKNENENQINNFLTSHSNIKKISEKQFFGYENNTDGFYICKMLKV